MSIYSKIKNKGIPLAHKALTKAKKTIIKTEKNLLSIGYQF